MSRTVTPTEAVAGGIAALQRLGMRARLYSEELLRAQVRLVELEFSSEAAWRAVTAQAGVGEAYRARLRRESERLRPLGALLREFGTRCDTLSFNLQPAREQLEEALKGLDTIGVGRGAISHFTRGDGAGVKAVYGASVDTFLAEHPEHSEAFTRHVGRATEAYAHAESSRDQLAAGLKVILDAVDAL